MFRNVGPRFFDMSLARGFMGATFFLEVGPRCLTYHLSLRGRGHFQKAYAFCVWFFVRGRGSYTQSETIKQSEAIKQTIPIVTRIKLHESHSASGLLFWTLN